MYDDEAGSILCHADGAGNDIWICGDADTVWFWHTGGEARTCQHRHCPCAVYPSGVSGACDTADAHCAGLLPVREPVHDDLQPCGGRVELSGDVAPEKNGRFLRHRCQHSGRREPQYRSAGCGSIGGAEPESCFLFSCADDRGTCHRLSHRDAGRPDQADSGDDGICRGKD